MATADDTGFGPIPVQNHHPLYVPLLHPTPERAAPVTDVTPEFSIDHTSIFLFGRDDEWTALVDKELTQVHGDPPVSTQHSRQPK